MTSLSVNLNKVAVLRNARGGDQPDLRRAAETCIAAGCAGITVHPRPDRRHVTAEDVAALAERTRGRVEFNIEGNPFAATRPGYPGLLELARLARPAQVTLVPDDEGQLTSDHGFDLVHDTAGLAPVVAGFTELGCRVSVFVNSDCTRDGCARARSIGIARLELYTGPFAAAFASGDATAELQRCALTARHAETVGLGLNAGHDLDQGNLAALLAAVPGVAEVSIGHALIGEALYDGLARTVRNYLAILDQP